MNEEIEFVTDLIDYRMEELAALTAAWQKNRDRDRPSPILRKAVIMVVGELWDQVELLKDSD